MHDPHSRNAESERNASSVCERVATGEHIRITRRGQAVPLITSCCLVCINADVSIPPRPSSFPRYVVALHRSRRQTCVTCVTMSHRSDYPGLFQPQKTVLELALATLVSREMHMPDGFNCRYASPRRYPQYHPRCPKSLRAKLVTDLVLYSRECQP